jgi:hypothetical protein
LNCGIPEKHLNNNIFEKTTVSLCLPLAFLQALCKLPNSTFLFYTAAVFFMELLNNKFYVFVRAGCSFDYEGYEGSIVQVQLQHQRCISKLALNATACNCPATWQGVNLPKNSFQNLSEFPIIYTFRIYCKL